MNADPVIVKSSVPDFATRVREVCQKYVSTYRAFSAKKSRKDIIKTLRLGDTVYFLFKNKRWSSSNGKIEAMSYLANKHGYGSVRSPMKVLPILVEFGLLTIEDSQQYAEWATAREAEEDHKSQVRGLQVQAYRFGFKLVAMTDEAKVELDKVLVELREP